MSKIKNLIGYCRNRGYQIHIRYPDGYTQIGVLDTEDNERLIYSTRKHIRQKDAALEALRYFNEAKKRYKI